MLRRVFSLIALAVLAACGSLPKDPQQAHAYCQRILREPDTPCLPGPGSGFCEAGSAALSHRKAQCAELFRQAPSSTEAQLAGSVDDPRVDWEIGRKYAQGQGVPKDAKLAVYWYELAAQRGFADAQWALGLAYVTGDGVSVDLVKGMTWMNRAAKKWGAPNAEAQVHNVLLALDVAPSKLAEAERIYHAAVAQHKVPE